MATEDSSNCPRGEGECPIYNEVAELKNSIAELAEQVRTDSLTGLFNKRHLLSSLETELERTCRSQHPTSLIMLDVDHFKAFNDNHGHLAGDKVLQHVARIIKNTIRKIDVACRYGGEEFAIVLPSTPLLTANHVAERVRKCIAEHAIEVNDKTLRVTASLGVSSYSHNQTANSEALIERADQQLYKAKNNGRNCISFETHKTEGTTNVSADERNALFDDTPQTLQTDNNESGSGTA